MQGSNRVAPGEPDEKVRTLGFALEIGAPVAKAAGAAAFGASVRAVWAGDDSRSKKSPVRKFGDGCWSYPLCAVAATVRLS